MMQMIVAGGLPALTDGLRPADENNPRGYFEWEPAKALKQNPEVVAQAEGHVVKIISVLLAHLPATHEYRILFMMRPLEEVVASQNRMLERMGKAVPNTPAAAVIGAFQKHLREVDGWLANKPYLKVTRVNHADVLTQPHEMAAMIAEFVGVRLSIDRMAGQVEGSLYRERTGSLSSASR